MEYRPRRSARTVDYWEIRQLRDAGLTTSEIAERLGTSPSVVLKSLPMPELAEIDWELVERMQEATNQEEQQALMAELHEGHAVSITQLGEMLGVSRMTAYYRLHPDRRHPERRKRR